MADAEFYKEQARNKDRVIEPLNKVTALMGRAIGQLEEHSALIRKATALAGRIEEIQNTLAVVMIDHHNISQLLAKKRNRPVPK